MSDRASIDALLKDLSAGALRLDDDGQCVIHDPDGVVFRIEVPVASDLVYWIAPLSAYRGAGDSGIAEKMLKAGHLALETRGAHLSIDVRAQEFVLWTSQPLTGLTAATFEKVTLNFADLATEWTGRLQEWRQAEPEGREEYETSEEAMISFRI